VWLRADLPRACYRVFATRFATQLLGTDRY
jgi:hypothetical protein